MVVLTACKNFVIVGGGENVLSINSSKGEHEMIECCAKTATGTTQSVNAVSNDHVYVNCVSLSKCGNFLAVCFNRSLILLKTDQWRVISVRDLARISNCVKFTPSTCYLVVADRSGDAYLYSVENPMEPGVLLLGHTSMLVDILVTSDEKFVVTCDRDEKIRISNFPHAYNIHSFCLGHENFVSCICELPHDVSVLVSGSGDGTVRFWDFFNGTEIYVCSEEFRKIVVPDNQHEADNHALKTHDSDTSVEGSSLPIRCISWFKKNSESSVGCVCVGSLDCCFILCASGRKDVLTISMMQKISLEKEPWVASFSDTGVLWILQQVEGKSARAFTLNTAVNHFEENCGLDGCSLYALSTINSKWEFFRDQDAPKVLSILYKRLFDDVQEYHERKKARLLSTPRTGVEQMK